MYLVTSRHFVHTYLSKRSLQQVCTVASAASKADVFKNITQSGGATNRIPDDQSESGELATIKANCASWFKVCLPATQALMRDTHVPVIIALNTRDDTSPRLEGHIEALRGKRRLYLYQIVEVYFYLIYFFP